ncbi:hypothetical protein Taro_041117, partial [Colocasia esculenta]|nr:hypothetical protein [Colocasia esculenta]
NLVTCPNCLKSNSEFKKYLDKPFPYKRQLDILCGKTTVWGSHFMDSTQEVDVEARQSFGDDDSVGRKQFNAMGLESSQFYSIDGDNFNPFDFPSSSQPNPPSRPVGEKTPTNIHPVEDEASSPARRWNDHASTCSRKRKSKKSFDPTILSQYCMMNNEHINMVRALFPRPSVDVDALVREILCEENGIFLAMDEAIADEIFESNEEHSVPRPMHTRGREDEDDEIEEDPNLSVSASDMAAGGALRDAIATQLWMANEEEVAKLARNFRRFFKKRSKYAELPMDSKGKNKQEDSSRKL